MLKRVEASALADTGLAVSEALRVITHTATAERALGALRVAQGRVDLSLVLVRPEVAALAAIAAIRLAVTRVLPTLADVVDVAHAQRGLAELRGAMRRSNPCAANRTP